MVRSRVSVFLTRLACIGIGFALFGASAIADPVAVELPAQPLASALREFARQTGIQVAVPAELTDGKTAPAVKGSFEPIDALSKLLKGSGLSAYPVNRNTYGIRRESAASTPQAGPNPPGAGNSTVSSSNPQIAQLTEPKRPVQYAVEPVEPEDGEKKGDLEEIVVTGSHIEGTSNPTAPVIVIDRAEIEKSGYTTTQQLVSSLPQNYGGGSASATEDGELGSGNLANQNDAFGTGISLRGLGASSTLILLNGQRMSPSAQGIFVDVSVIPLSAIERVEIMTDGASAIYGTDAVGGVVNFITRQDYKGADSWVNYGAGSDGNRQQVTVGQAAGTRWNGGNAFGSIQYQDIGALSAADRSYTASSTIPTDLLPESRQYSAVFSIRQDLPAGFEISSDVLYSNSHKLGYTSTTDYEVISSTTGNNGVATVSLGYRPTDSWHITLTASDALSDTSLAQTNAFIPPYTQCDGGDFCTAHDNYKEFNGELIANGTLFQAPGGPAKAAVGTSYRNEAMTVFAPLTPAGQNLSQFDRHVVAEFAELEMPIIGKNNSLPFMKQVDLSLAVRHDQYTDFGGTTNPRYGIAWKPLDSIRLRAAYSTSFRAPSAFEATKGLGNGIPLLGEIPFPSPTGGEVPVFLEQVSNNKLGPERSHNWTAGIEFSVPQHSLKVSLDYFNIRYTNRIVEPNLLNDGNALSELGAYGPLITRIPSDAAAQAIINQALALGGEFIDLTCGEPTGCNGAKGVRYELNNYEQNAALELVSGFDFTGSYAIDLAGNKFHASVNTAYIAHMDTSYTATTTPIDLINTYNNPLHWRARSQIDWNRGPWSIATAVNSSGSYIDTSTVPRASIASWTTVDAQISYSPPTLKNLALNLSCTNLLDKDPPWVAGTNQFAGVIHYDVGNGNPLGRIVVFGARYSW